jgi:hypothetical protein
MNHDDDDALFRRMLEASAPDVEVPSGFAERVVSLAKQEPTARRRARWMMPLGLAAGALLAGTWGYTHRRIEGVIAPREELTEVRLGARAVAVLAPGTSGHFAVGGLLGERDVMHLDHGSAFLRVEAGGPFAVVTPEGEVAVLGTCFEVTRMEDEMVQVNAVRGRSFGAGAITMGMLVAVYEGSVHVSRGHADAGEGMTLAAGQQALLDREGEVRALASPATAIRPASGGTHTSEEELRDAQRALGAAAAADAAREENARLRALLERHAISPESGEFLPNARRGLDDAGNTDLTPEEWSTLADRGELRFRLPGDESGGMGDHVRTSAGLSEDEATRLDETMRGAYRDLMSRVGEAYRAATGRAPDGCSLAVMMSEIEDHTAADEAAHVRWMLAQERAGRGTTRSDPMSEYERMMRQLVEFEGDLEQQAATQVGEERAHQVIYESSAHSFGMTGRPRGDEETPRSEAP